MLTVSRHCGLWLALALAAGRAGASEQGNAGPTSRGAVTITASVAVRNTVEGLADIASNRSVATQDVCLWSSGATRGFGLAAAGDGADGALVALDGSGAVRPYGVTWGGTPLAAGAPRLGLTATATSPGCRADASGRTRLIVTFATAMRDHAGTLSLLVIPQ
jgi:hypothetical protein